jgi:hypothetical protein
MSKKRSGSIIFLIVFVFFSGIFCLDAFQNQDRKRPRIENNQIYWIQVPADHHWVDTGFDVERGEIIYFKAEGTLSLQKGNPKAYCDPDGYSLKTMQQPLTDQNIGALIGRVVLLISIEKDEETGEEIRNEIVKEFFIGRESEVIMPIKGELHLGINELVVEDNGGSFQVHMELINK